VSILRINPTNMPSLYLPKLLSKAVKFNCSEPRTLSSRFGSIPTNLAMRIIRPPITFLCAELMAALCN